MRYDYHREPGGKSGEESMRIGIALFTALMCLTPALAQERIEIPNGTEKPLIGVAYRPAGAGPFPVVVALHGCGGLTGSNGTVSLRHADWGKRLAERGYLVVFPDSYASRGLGSQCLVKDRTVRPGKERVADLQATRQWLLQRSDVVKDRISLLGWSNGGSSVLWAVAADKKPKDNGPDFRSAVAFYPGCRLLAQAADRKDWENRIPLLILIGDKDDWTPAAPCQQLAAATVAAGRRTAVVTYPDAVHEFDHPNRETIRRKGLAFTANDTGEAMVGTNPEARADALNRVPDFLAQ
jgi:dienelactone hydrolase